MRYLDPRADHRPEQDYDIVDGVVVDETERPTCRKAWNGFTRAGVTPSREERLAEEAAWAARSGPCVIIKPGRGAA